MPNTQRILRNDLNKLIQGRPLSPRQLSPVQNTIGGARPISPPAPPTSSPTQLLRSPRSPRERTSRKTSSKSPPRSPRLENHEGTKYQMKDKTLVLNNVRIVPGCAAKLPQFYFPLGKPDDSNSALYDDKLSEVTKVFQRFDGSVPNGEFGAVAKVWFIVLSKWNFTVFLARKYTDNTCVTL